VDINQKAKDADIDPKTYVKSLSHEKPKVRAIAAYGIGVLNAREYLPKLIEVLHADENEIVRVSVILGLNYFKKLNILSDIEFALNDKSSAVKIAAIDLFAKRKYLNVKEKIISCLKDNVTSVKLFALDYISALKLSEYKEAVYNLVFDKNIAVIQSAIITLADLKAGEYANKLNDMFSGFGNPLIKMTLDLFR
jgi:HEAT repeat protein